MLLAGLSEVQRLDSALEGRIESLSWQQKGRGHETWAVAVVFLADTFPGAGPRHVDMHAKINE